MRIEPDREQASSEQQALVQVLSTVVARAWRETAEDGAEGADRSDPVETLDATPGQPVYPGWFAVAHAARSLHRPGHVDPADRRRRLGDRLRSTVAQARASAERVRTCACSSWQADLAPPELHAAESLERAVAQIPKTPEQSARLVALAVGEWEQAPRAVFCRSSCLLASAWPEALGEMSAVVRQVTLLRGHGIDGFTDFAAHGALFLNEHRLQPAPGGVPPVVRFAEALVHEAAHTRCNMSTFVSPLVGGSAAAAQTLVPTPLRRDLRPLMGLLQQLVVLARCVVLYDRVLERGVAHDAVEGADAGAVGAVGERRELLFRQGAQALETLDTHASKLSDSGGEAVDDARAVLRRASVARR